MCFGVDGITIFQGTKIRVIIQLKEKHTPYFIGVHYMASYFVIPTLSTLSITQKIEAML